MTYLREDKDETLTVELTDLTLETHQAARFKRILDSARRFAELIREECMPSNPTGMALHKLGDVVYWAEHAIARLDEVRCTRLPRELVFADVKPGSEPSSPTTTRRRYSDRI